MTGRLVIPVCLTLFAAAMFPAGAPGAPKQDLVKSQLLADVSWVKPGEPFTVGVLLTITPGWHVYWENPGDSGLATSVKLKVPAGFTAGPVHYPLPVVFSQPGDVVGYGYTDKVLLMAEVTPPKELAGGKPVVIGASASWLCCEKVCIPGHAKLELSLPVSDKAAPDNAELFKSFAALIPVDPKSSPDVAGVKVSREPGSRTFHIDVDWKYPPRGTQLFPTANDAVTFKERSRSPEGGTTTRFVADVEILQGQAVDADALPVVIGYTSADGQRHAIEARVPLGGLQGAGTDKK